MGPPLGLRLGGLNYEDLYMDLLLLFYKSVKESIGTVDLDSLQDRSSLDPRIRRTISFFDFGMFV